MLRIDPTTGLTVDHAASRAHRALGGALLGVAFGSLLVLGAGLWQRLSAVEAVDGDPDPMSVELRAPLAHGGGHHRVRPPCPATHRCPMLRAHPELLTELESE